MMSKAIVLLMTWTTIFNLPFCCCVKAPNAKSSALRDRGCGHCPKKSSSGPEQGHGPTPSGSSHPQSECGCTHVTLDAMAEFSGISLPNAAFPDAWECLSFEAATAPTQKPEPAPFFDRGPPPDRLTVPIYLFDLHLTI